MSWNLRDVTVLWLFNARSDGNLEVVVLQRRRSEGVLNSFVTEDLSSRKRSRGQAKCYRRGFGANGSIALTSAVSHVGRTSNAFKVTMKLQTFLFQMVVTSCIYIQYL